jgi:hypothetical protein
VISADGAVVNHDIPSPESHRIPLLTSISSQSMGKLEESTFLTSNLFLSSAVLPDSPGLDGLTDDLEAGAAEESASCISTSAILCKNRGANVGCLQER